MRGYFRVSILTLLLAVAGLFYACNPITVTTLPDASLADTSWILVSYGLPGSPTFIPVGSTITLNFRGLGGYDGSTGINGYGGASRIDGDNLIIRDVTQTQLEDPLGDVYLALLRKAQSFEYTAEKLMIHCRGGEFLIFRPA